jgi:hypothetical protein
MIRERGEQESTFISHIPELLRCGETPFPSSAIDATEIADAVRYSHDQVLSQELMGHLRAL